MEIFINLSGDCLARQSIEVFRELVEELPFLDGISVLRAFIVPLLDLFEVFNKFTEFLVLISIYLLFDRVRYLLSLLFVFLLPNVSIFSHEISHTLLQLLFQLLQQIWMAVFWPKRSLLELSDDLLPQLIFNLRNVV